MNDVVGRLCAAEDAPKVGDVEGDGVTENLGVGRAQTHDYLCEIGHGPICPKCRLDTFDDWWHDPSFKYGGGVLSGRLKCHGCGVFFSMTKHANGYCHSSLWKKKRLTPPSHSQDTPDSTGTRK